MHTTTAHVKETILALKTQASSEELSYIIAENEAYDNLFTYIRTEIIPMKKIVHLIDPANILESNVFHFRKWLQANIFPYLL